MIRVMLVDDQTLVRKGVRSLLELADDIDVVAEAADGQAAIDQIDDVRPDVLMLDMRMPGKSGLDVMEELQARNDLPPTLILTTFDDDELLLAGIRAGARGYLLKDVGLEELLSGVRTVAEGKTLVKPAVTERLMKGLREMRTEFSSLSQPDPMTDRETEILRLMAGGYSNKEIAGALNVAEGTVKNHVSNILSKMGVRDRTRAVLKALEGGLI
jgi:DNA-binding NarL/FixJ family response regulator